MKKLQELEEQISAIQEQIDEMKKVEEEWPKFGDEVWMLGMEVATVVSTYTDSPMWKYKLATGSLHRTEADAAAYRDWLTSPRTQARRMVEMCDGYNPAGVSGIGCDIDYGLRISGLSGEAYFKHGYYNGMLRFSSCHQAQAAIVKLGEDTIKLALGIEE